LRVANDALQGRTTQTIGETAVYYHSTRVKPHWARTKKFIATIGKHLFYAD
jgi:spore germination cell wall hydrolase CwlJ-like protein